MQLRSFVSIFSFAASMVATAGVVHPTEGVQFKLPVDCKIGRNCAIQHYVDHDLSSDVRDYACGRRTYDGHDGTDFRLPHMKAQQEGVNVLAAAAGRVIRTRDGEANASVRIVGRDAVKGRECGNGVIIEHAGGWQTQYCHLDRQTLRVRPNDEVEAGQPLGRIGLSGLAEFPHLHFTVRRGTMIADPFAYSAKAGSCAAGLSLWDRAAEDQLTYAPALVLNIGFSNGPVTMETIESGVAGGVPISPDSAVLVAFARAIGLRAGDVPRIVLTGVDGRLLADVAANPLERDKAQYMMFAGKQRSAAGWLRGRYNATFSVRREGAGLIERSLDLLL